MDRGGTGSVGWRASLRSGAQGEVDPGGSTITERQCGSGGQGGRGDRGGQPMGHLAGRDGVDVVGAAPARGSCQDMRERCGNGMRKQRSADRQRCRGQGMGAMPQTWAAAASPRATWGVKHRGSTGYHGAVADHRVARRWHRAARRWHRAACSGDRTHRDRQPRQCFEHGF
jgi:hypothetical protein